MAQMKQKALSALLQRGETGLLIRAYAGTRRLRMRNRPAARRTPGSVYPVQKRGCDFVIVYALPEVLLVVCLASPIVICALKKRVRGWALAARVLLFFYVLYAARWFFFPILLDSNGSSGLGLELMPLLPLLELTRSAGVETALRQIGGNVLAFMPLTFLCAAAEPRFRSLCAGALLAAGCSVGVELLQLGINLTTGVANRAVSVNDVLLNLAGGLLGLACWRLANALLHRAGGQSAE